MKFGGTSVQNEEAINRVISIVKARLRERPVVVVSALAKVTRLLVQIAEEAENGSREAVKRDLEALRLRHIELCGALLQGDLLDETAAKVESLCNELSLFVDGVCRIGELSQRSRARIVSTGELLSSTIVAAAFNEQGIPCNWMDARKVVVTDDNYMSAAVYLDETRSNIQRIMPDVSRGAEVVLTQGFIASTRNGFSSVLGFEGSDYSAALFGMALDAGRVEIWTDVNGIRTSDPRVVSETKRIERVSYEEAAAMAGLGARVLHPLTIGPARMRNIPIRVLNTMNPFGEGTVVARDDESSAIGAKCIAFIPDIEYVEISAREYGQAGAMAGEVFTELSSKGIVTSLASSSVSKLSLTFEPGQDGLRDVMESLGEKYDVNIFRDKAQVSVVGKSVALCNGVADVMHEVKPYMMSVGASLMDISVVIDRSCLKDAVNKIHEKLF